MPETWRTDSRLLQMLVCPLTKMPLSYDAERQELVSKAAGSPIPSAMESPSCFPKRRGTSTVTDPWPEELRVADKGRVLHVTFDSGERHALDAEYLRVESPSAEVKGHGPARRSWSGANATSPSPSSIRSAATR